MERNMEIAVGLRFMVHTGLRVWGLGFACLPS